MSQDSFTSIMDAAVKAATMARYLEAEAKLNSIVSQGEQVLTLMQHPDGKMTALVSPVGKMFSHAVEVDVLEEA